jgi:hypothetical protein
MKPLTALLLLSLAACASSPRHGDAGFEAARNRCLRSVNEQLALENPQGSVAGNEGTSARAGYLYQKCMRDAGWPQPPETLPTPPIMPPSPPAVPSATAAPQTDGGLAAITIDSQPPLAEVWIDGRFAGSAPLHVPLAAGTHAIEVRRAGFANWRRELFVTAGVPAKVVALLEK